MVLHSGMIFTVAASAAPFDWTSIILGFCFALLLLILLASLVHRIARRRRGDAEAAFAAEGAHEAAELARREQLERRAPEYVPVVGQNLAGTGGAS